MTWYQKLIVLIVFVLFFVGFASMLHQSPTTLPAGCVYQEAG